MPKTDGLIPLQELDLSIHQLRTLREAKPKALAGVEAKVVRAKENLEAMRAEIKALKLEAQKRETSIKEFDDKITKLVTQSNMAKKNDEYQAFQKEISGIKADRSRVEDGLLDLLMQVDEKSKLEKIRDQEMKQVEGEYNVEKKKNEGEVAELDRQISEVAAKREAIVSGIDKELLRSYDRILRAKDDGVALAPVVMYESVEPEGLTKYWGCGGCSVGVTNNDINELRRGKEVVTCRSCSRILYWKPEPPKPV